MCTTCGGCSDDAVPRLIDPDAEHHAQAHSHDARIATNTTITIRTMVMVITTRTLRTMSIGMHGRFVSSRTAREK